ncbi:MAG TPA: alcohol dehydrogenase catalytic domain-containing protein [Actinomycetota bacterium]|nr:alcohol dehydrogenase catalytic domain-containing protein [Actinomycetota bacterium]
MKAVVYDGAGGVRVDDVPEPKIERSTDALIEVTRGAICGSDLHILTGKTPGVQNGDVIGHEFVGVVKEVGDEVNAFTAGQRVIGSFLIACGSCGHCGAGRFNLCGKRRAIGFGALTGGLGGSQAELVRIPKADINLHAIAGDYAELDDEQALFGGDILTTGFYGAARSEINTDDVVVVVGAGPVGLFCAGAAKRYSPAKVIVLDQDANRVAFARDEMGLDALDVSSDDPAKAVLEATGGRAADIAIEAVGHSSALETAMAVIRDGGRVTVIGVYGVDRYEMPMGLCWVRGIDLRFAGMANVQGHWDEALLAVAKGEIDPTKIVSHRLPLDDAVEGYELFRSREALKVVLTP